MICKRWGVSWLVEQISPSQELCSMQLLHILLHSLQDLEVTFQQLISGTLLYIFNRVVRLCFPFILHVPQYALLLTGVDITLLLCWFCTSPILCNIMLLISILHSCHSIGLMQNFGVIFRYSASQFSTCQLFYKCKSLTCLHSNHFYVFFIHVRFFLTHFLDCIFSEAFLSTNIPYLRVYKPHLDF
jgi:hypothetical protein